MQMKIAIDTFYCDSGKSGNGIYVQSLIQNLAKNEQITLELFGSVVDKYTYDSDFSQIKYKTIQNPIKNKAFFLWHKFGLKKFVKKNNYDFVIFPLLHKVAPISKSINSVAICNTILSKVIDETHTFIHKKIILNAYKKVKTIITSSNFLKEDLIKLCISGNKIFVIPNGINHSLFYPQTELIVQEYVNIKPFAIQRPYFIYATRVSDYSKKHVELIKAFELFKKNTNFPHRLVLAGDIGKIAENVNKVIQKSQYASDIFLTGHFPHDSLRDLYIASDGCIFPATCEGFGFPILEAMACGVPVACSDSGSLKETVGDNVIFFNSNNIEEIAIALEKLITDKELVAKNIKNGITWSNNFSWKKTATKTIDILVSR